MQKTYHVDLAGLMRVYETNYAKMNSLLPFDPDGRRYAFVSSLANGLSIRN